MLYGSLNWLPSLFSPFSFFKLFFLKVVLSTLAFTAFELPPNGAIGTKILEFLFHSRPDLVRTLFSRQLQYFACANLSLPLSFSCFMFWLESHMKWTIYWGVFMPWLVQLVGNCICRPIFELKMVLTIFFSLSLSLLFRVSCGNLGWTPWVLVSW